MRFFVPGVPAPQGSKRVYVRGGRAVLVESSAKVKPWRQAVAAIAIDQQASIPRGASVKVDLRFVLPRPKGHYGTGRNADSLRASAPRRHVQKPDVDKLIRSTLDGLTDAAVYGDDSNVTTVQATKAWAYPGEPTGAHIELTYHLDTPNLED